ncbi:hypothetical protein M441DRAFT_62906 [Trichoderma asperellum CBS 433.97]|uniref:Uncharacterized protein n=1 Tax=Trichoderma asperellum (strain ATCC 204424 / CBS 433.97 / NBRC 101777) TaxID=1042311 RepID=A0A2T3YRT4_TRIA4|nr:hypothetical protein M441DRAFT_62906 [Trichoderma asperellum CBS 433.97]PTB35283.1 hypothetical protein M441DRAFT_62906 [Trichoderma asperellum CBS 433.97]
MARSLACCSVLQVCFFCFLLAAMASSPTVVRRVRASNLDAPSKHPARTKGGRGVRGRRR